MTLAWIVFHTTANALDIYIWNCSYFGLDIYRTGRRSVFNENIFLVCNSSLTNIVRCKPNHCHLVYILLNTVISNSNITNSKVTLSVCYSCTTKLLHQFQLNRCAIRRCFVTTYVQFFLFIFVPNFNILSSREVTCRFCFTCECREFAK